MRGPTAGRPGCCWSRPRSRSWTTRSPRPRSRSVAERTYETLNRMAALGITAAHAMERTRPQAWAATLEAEVELPVRLRCSPWVQPGTTERDWAAVAALQGTGGRRWQVRGVKLVHRRHRRQRHRLARRAGHRGRVDVAVLARSGRVLPSDRPGSTPDVPTTTHAIGDQGVRLRAARRSNGRRGRRAPHRIEHIETIPDDLVDAFATLPVTASMQPTHCTDYTRADGSDNWSTRLGAGGPSAAGGSATCATPAPGRARVGLADRGVRSARRPRRRPAAPQGRAGPSDAPIEPDQAITARMALEGYTTHAARADGLAGRVGHGSSVGKRADLTAFTVDPLTGPAGRARQWRRSH